MIRFIIGFLLVFGAVGGMDVETAPIVQCVAIALVGLSLMWWAIPAVNKESKWQIRTT